MDNLFTINEIEKKIDEFSEFNDFKGAYSYMKELRNYINSNIKNSDIATKQKYNEYIVILKFLSLQLLENWNEINTLLKEHYDVSTKIKYYDLWEKIKINLLYEPSFDERDRIKLEIKNILLNCPRPLIDKAKYREINNLPILVSEWLKRYNVVLGVNKVNNLKKVEFLTRDAEFNKLKEDDKQKVRKLFDLYERLKYSSKERYGAEESVPMIVDGKLTILEDGEGTIVNDDIKSIIKSLGSSEEKISLSKFHKPLAVPQTQEETEIKNLEEMAAQYELGSLERRAIEEEIRKMKLSIRYQNIKK